MCWIAKSVHGNQILWLHGPAGAGKSAIAQIIAERTDGCELAASFFFSRGNSSRNTIQRLWATVAFQIATSIPALRHIIGTSVVDNPSIIYKSADSQLQTLIIEPFRSYQTHNEDMPPGSPFLVVIDGLDECQTDRDQCLILNSISAVIDTHHLPLRFLIEPPRTSHSPFLR
jgi:hypothetical protein